MWLGIGIAALNNPQCQYPATLDWHSWRCSLAAPNFLAKGTSAHRLLGWLWVTMMAYVAVSSFFISTIQTWRGFSPIHLLSVWTLLALAIAVYHARAGNIRQHQRWMVQLYVLALLVTGLFTLWPGRLMHEAFFRG